MDDTAITEDDKVKAKAVAIEEIPLIDFAPFLHGGEEGRRAVAAEIGRACESIGFFYLTGHGVPQSVRQAVFDRAADFYHLPLENRQQQTATQEWNRGWIQSKPGEKLTADSRVFEQYRIEREFAPDDPALQSGSVFCQPNRWPSDDVPGFAEDCTRYFTAMQGLARQLLQAFAMGLGLPADRFERYCANPISQMSLMYYPSLPDSVGNEIKNTIAHTDDGPVTILAQGEIAGLEVKTREGAWIAAPPIPGAYTINIGNMMMWWSNGRYISTVHRVRNISRVERFSVPFFFNLDEDAVVEPLPELVDGEPRFVPVTVGQLMSRYYKSIKYEAFKGAAKS